MYFIRTNNSLFLDDLYDCEAETIGEQNSTIILAINFVPPASTDERTVNIPTTSKASTISLTVACPICGDVVAGTRFAPHLEKCMNGGKRGSRKYFDVLGDDAMVGFRPPKVKVAVPDPHPESLVVRIRMKYGGATNAYCFCGAFTSCLDPWGNLRRMGASLEEFEQSVLDVQTARLAAPEVSSPAGQTTSSRSSPRSPRPAGPSVKVSIEKQVMAVPKRVTRKLGEALLEEGLVSERTLRSRLVAPDPHPESLVVRIKLKQGGESQTEAKMVFLLNIVH